MIDIRHRESREQQVERCGAVRGSKLDSLPAPFVHKKLFGGRVYHMGQIWVFSPTQWNTNQGGAVGIAPAAGR